MEDDTPLSTRDTIDLMGAFAFALQATMPVAQSVRFRQTLELIEQQVLLQDRPAVAAALRHIAAALPPVEEEADPGTSAPKH
jgi:hypothetical protein